MEVIEEDEDVVLEGSAFHKVLQDTGCMDYQPIVVNRRSSEESQPTYKFFERLHNIIKRTAVWNLFDNAAATYLCETQLATILQAETLLVEHAEIVQSLLSKNSQSFWSKLGSCSTLIASAAILGLSCLMEKRRNMYYIATLLGSSAAAFSINRQFNDVCAISALKNLVSSQNELHQLYKKGLRIMSKQFGFKPNSNQISTRFSNLEIDRLKYVQPLTEILLTSLASLSQTYYNATLTIAKILPKNVSDDIFVRFEDEAFSTDGEIMYDQFRSLYYVYVMVQSDAMQLLAVAYDKDTWIRGEKIPRPRLTRIVRNLCMSIRSHRTNLSRIIEKYESCKPIPIQRTYRGPRTSRWKDLYLNLNLLSQKVATVYDTIGHVLEEIDDHDDDALSANDDFVVGLEPRLHEIYKHIDSARNFAEFSELLVIMLKRSVRREENVVAEKSENPTMIASDLPIIRDTDPQIIDEVFEEYITEEYIKSLYNDDEEPNSESAKLDKLLAKNFMSELKDALVEKYKSMSERETKALMRKNREKNGDAAGKSEIEESSIPRPPPLPTLPSVTVKRQIVHEREKNVISRSPVPLPRIGTKMQNSKDVARNVVVSQQLHSSVIPPPPPPPRIEAFEANERFSFDLSKIGRSRIPAFVNFEEEFVGSGENSEEEPVDDGDCENNVDANVTS